MVQQPTEFLWQTNFSNLQNSNAIRCLKKRLAGVLSESVNKRSVVSVGVKTPYQCSGIVSHQTSPSKMCNFISIHFQVDNMNVFTHQMKMGDPLNKEIIPKRISKEIWEFAFSKEIMITVEYLPGRLDIRADWASRNYQDSSDWLLSPRVFQDICVKWRFQELELFASGACHQEIPSYLSWKADPHSLATDAFQQSWKHRRLLYAFLPFPMIGKVLLKVETEELDAILITPS